MDKINLFYNNNPYHNQNIRKNNFCSICYKLTDHNILNCPYKCTKCKGFHKTHEHRCLICNVRDPKHNINECLLLFNYNRM